MGKSIYAQAFSTWELPKIVLTKFAARFLSWTSTGSAGCNTARLKSPKDTTRGRQPESPGNTAFPWATSQGASAGTQQLPQGLSDTWQHSPGSLSLRRGSCAHGIGFSIPNPQIRVSQWILQGSVHHHECNPKRQQLPSSWIIQRKLWTEAWKEPSPCACGSQGGLGELLLPQQPPPPLPAGFRPAFVNTRSSSPAQNVGEQCFVIMLWAKSQKIEWKILGMLQSWILISQGHQSGHWVRTPTETKIRSLQRWPHTSDTSQLPHFQAAEVPTPQQYNPESTECPQEKEKAQQET